MAVLEKILLSYEDSYLIEWPLREEVQRRGREVGIK